MGNSDSDSEHSENNGNKSHSKEDGKIGFGFLLSAALVGLVLPALFGVNGLEILIWVIAASVLFYIGTTVLLVSGVMKFFEKKGWFLRYIENDSENSGISWRTKIMAIVAGLLIVLILNEPWNCHRDCLF